MRKLHRTIEDCIRDIGQIPLCQCEDKNGLNCGLKVNIDPKNYCYYKRKGYPRFISGHEHKGKNHQFYGKTGELAIFYGKHHSEKAKEKSKISNNKTWNNQEKLYEHSNVMKEIWNRSGFKQKRSGKGASKYGKSSHHSKQIYLHSTLLQGERKMHRWEHLYASYLDSIGEEYYYEPKAFPMTIFFEGKFKDTTYQPDFYLPNENTFVEIKGYWRNDAKLKSDTFREEYCINNYNYEILFEKDLQKLGIELKEIKKCQK